MKTKRLLAMLLAIVMVFALVACTTNPDPEPSDDTKPTPTESTPATDPAPTDTTPVPQTAKVGISMPTNDLQRWNQDGANLKEQLEAKGYEVVIQFASNDAQVQATQIENMIADGCNVLVIAAKEANSLGTVLAQAKENNVISIAYDRLILDTADIDYYVSFDNFTVGAVQGEYIKTTLDLDNAEGPFNIELAGGDPGDNNARVFFDGEMSILKPYIDSGKLVVVSGQTEFDQIATNDWDAATAQARMENILSTYYADKPLHAVCCANDSTALGTANALASNYTNDVYPVITGQDCDIVNVKNIMAGKQAMSVFKDTRLLAAQTVAMVEAILQGGTPEVNNTTDYHNGKFIVPSYLCDPTPCTKDNYEELLLGSGYYKAEELA